MLRNAASALGAAALLLFLGCDAGIAPGVDAASDPCAPVTGDRLTAMTPCDPLTQRCAGTLACYSQVPLGGCPFQCIGTSGPGWAELADCMYLNDCAVGLQCIDGAFYDTCPGRRCCVPFCDLRAPACTRGQCRSFFEGGTPPPGFEHVGVCAGP